MPQFGSYSDGSPGQATDEVVVKRSGTGTLRVPFSALPVQDAAVAAFPDKTAHDQFVENTNLALSLKESILTFSTTTNASVSRVGNTVYIPGLGNVAGQIADGKSWMVLGSSSTNLAYYGPNLASGSMVGTINNNVGPNNPTNGWVERGRFTMTSAATANSHVRFAVSPKIRWPENTTTAYGGFRITWLWAPRDAVTAVGFIGLTQNLITAGTAPSAYTGSRWGLMYDPALAGADTNLKLYNGGTLIQDFGASFPGNGNETNAYMFDLQVRPFPNYGATYTLTNLVSGATASGSTTSIPLGTFDPIVHMVRDNQATATAVVLASTGCFGGAFCSMVVGDSTTLIPTPNTITTSTSLTKTLYANIDNVANSATPITLTIDNTGYVFGDTIAVDNIGAGSVSFAGASGVTINQHADVPASLAQWQSGSLLCLGSNNWIRRA